MSALAPLGLRLLLPFIAIVIDTSICIALLSRDKKICQALEK